MLPDYRPVDDGAQLFHLPDRLGSVRALGQRVTRSKPKLAARWFPSLGNMLLIMPSALNGAALRCVPSLSAKHPPFGHSLLFGCGLDPLQSYPRHRGS
jgi:hypothetical protein